MPWASTQTNPTHDWCSCVAQDIRIPDIGDIDQVEVVEVCVAAGDVIAAGDPLVVIESDKASMEVPAEAAGTVAAVLVQVGDNVGEGDPVVSLEVDGAVTAEPVAVAEPASQPAPVAAAVEPETSAAAQSAADSQASAPAVTTTLEVRVPDIGEATDVVVIEVAVKPGQQVTADDLLVVVESDKASMEIPAGQAGTVEEVHIAEGSSVAEGTLLVTLAAEQIAVPAAEAAAPAAMPATPPAAPVAAVESVAGTAPVAGTASAAAQGSSSTQAAAGAGSKIYAGPAVRRLARELGVELTAVAGTGSRGRIVKDDVKAFVKTRLTGAAEAGGTGLPALPEVDFAKFGPIELEPMSRVRAAGAVNLQRSWLNLPHVTQHDEADVTELEAFRATLKDEASRRGVKITPLAFIIKACCYALKEFPHFNASLDPAAENFILKRYYHIGFAVDTPEGLLVPVIKDADTKGVWELSEEVAELADKARQQKLGLGDMQGGTFSVSSLGAIGGTGFTPIINAPEVAILGIARLTTRPVWDGESFEPRKLLPLSLSYDHRAINGAEAGRFVSVLSGLLSDIRRLSL